MKTTEDIINESFEKVRKSANKAINEAFKKGKEVGVMILATELIDSPIDELPFLSGFVKEVADRLLEEMRGKENE